jgi:cytochrome c oxidase cbb3-type subunit 3
MVYAAHCADCHGPDGRGEKGVTDLTRGQFNFGSDAEAVFVTIRDGRRAEMPGVGSIYGELQLGQIVAYVETLASNAPLADYEADGRDLFRKCCTTCHGEDGRCRPALGAPDLADDSWQHGASMMNVRLAITRGTRSECPPHGPILSPVEINLLNAYVLRLANP